MVLLLGLLQFIMISIICVYELKRKSVAIFLWAVLLVMFGIMHMLSILLNTYEYSTDTMNEASLFVILFCCFYLITRYLTQRKKDIITEEKLELKNDEKDNMKKFMYVLFIGLIFIVFIRLIMLSRQAGGLLNTSWGTMRETVGGYFSFSQIFIPVFFVCSSCMILAIKLKNKKILILSVLVILLEVMISRNRIEILPIFCSVIYAFILKNKKFTIKQIAILALIGILSIYFIYALRVFRHSGSIENFFDTYNLVSFNEKVGEYLEDDSGELGLRKNMYYFIENNNNFEDFEKGHTYIRMALVLLPTEWSFGLKPEDFAITMGKAVLPTAVGYSVHPTLFGDVYANFGFFGFLMGIFWAIFVLMLDKIVIKSYKLLRLPISIICGIIYIIQARGSVYNAFSWLVYCIIILIFIYIMFRLIINTKKLRY